MIKKLHKKPTRPSIRGNTKTTREDWISAAQRLFVEEGIERVKVDRLAKNLGVTRGGFYWFFTNRQDLLQTLRSNWTDQQNDPITNAIERKNDTALDPFIRFFTTILDLKSYSPALDSAMRDWARTSSATRQAVDTVDDRRIKALTKAFKMLDYNQKDAFIRARILYFHQVGYYAMNIYETYEQRLRFIPIYFKQLTGFDLPENAIEKNNAAQI